MYLNFFDACEVAVRVLSKHGNPGGFALQSLIETLKGGGDIYDLMVVICANCINTVSHYGLVFVCVCWRIPRGCEC